MSFGRMGAMGRGFGRLGVGGSLATLNLSVSTFPANSTIGTVIGTLSVSHGSGSYTFSLTSNPGSLFSITTNQLKVANATITAGSYPVTIKADNGAGSVVTRSFLLTATGTSSGQPMGLLLSLTYP